MKNFHSHTWRCRHATGQDREYVLAAVRAGYTEIGISDHTPWPFTHGYKSDMRMQPYELSGYVKSVLNLRKEFAEDITIHLGMEVEYFSQYYGWLEGVMNQYPIDYLVLGNHYMDDERFHRFYGQAAGNRAGLSRYVEDTEKALATGMFSVVAHPDLFMTSYPAFDIHCVRAAERICKAAKRAHVPVEYNLKGVQKNRAGRFEHYPYHSFWEVAAAMGNDVIIGVDAHDPADYLEVKNRIKAEKYLSSLGMDMVEDIGFYDRRIRRLHG